MTTSSCATPLSAVDRHPNIEIRVFNAWQQRELSAARSRPPATSSA
jgi:hypothetical protein